MHNIEPDILEREFSSPALMRKNFPMNELSSTILEYLSKDSDSYSGFMWMNETLSKLFKPILLEKE